MLGFCWLIFFKGNGHVSVIRVHDVSLHFSDFNCFIQKIFSYMREHLKPQHLQVTRFPSNCFEPFCNACSLFCFVSFSSITQRISDYKKYPKGLADYFFL